MISARKLLTTGLVVGLIGFLALAAKGDLCQWRCRGVHCVNMGLLGGTTWIYEAPCHMNLFTNLGGAGQPSSERIPNRRKVAQGVNPCDDGFGFVQRINCMSNADWEECDCARMCEPGCSPE